VEALARTKDHWGHQAALFRFCLPRSEASCPLPGTTALTSLPMHEHNPGAGAASRKPNRIAIQQSEQVPGAQCLMLF